MIGVSVTPEMDEAVRRHAARLKISLTEFIRCLIAAELRRAGVDTAPLVARLGEGQGRRSDFDDDARRSRALAQLADARKARRAKTREKRIRKLAAERALPAPHAAALLRAVEAEEEEQQSSMTPARFRRVAALVLAELAARENDAASAAETASGAA